MKSAIVTLLEQLEKEPDNSFEREVVCEDEENFVLSEDNLAQVSAVLRRLETQYEEDRQRAEQLRWKIKDLIVKLEIDQQELRSVEQGGHSPTEIADVRDYEVGFKVLLFNMQV